MIRVHVICEGQTEEMFVNELMYAHFIALGVVLVPALVGKPGHKGGNFKFDRLLDDVRNRLLGDRESYCTTFFDFYGLPENFPGKRAVVTGASIEDKSVAINTALVARLESALGRDPLRRFIPFVQMYEFEALLFSDTNSFAVGIGKPELEQSFQQIKNMFTTPEQINDSPQTSPSKRVMQLVPGYEKPIMGSLASIEIGLGKIRQECHLFDTWLQELEALP